MGFENVPEDKILRTSIAMPRVTVRAYVLNETLLFTCFTHGNWQRIRLISCLNRAMICGINRITKISLLRTTKDPTCESITLICCIGGYAKIANVTLPAPGDLVSLADWTIAEYSIGIVVGSVPPCRTLFLQIASIFGIGKPRDRNTTSLQTSTSDSNLLTRFISNVSTVFSRSKPPPSNTKEQFSISKHWGNRNRRRNSLESEGSILPLRNVAVPSKAEAGIIKTVDFQVIGSFSDDRHPTGENTESGKW